MTKLSTSVSRLGIAAVVLIPWLLGCPKGDVGSACNHGDVEPPESKLVTFPALSCDDLLCVYADEDEPPTGGCGDDAGCNQPGEPVKFECIKSDPNAEGTCRLRVDYVLERSMCSKKCSNDNDCKDGGPTKQVVVDDSSCSTGFSCARIQKLGKFCCEKLCVCNDDLGVTSDVDAKCSAGTQEGCCDQEVVPAACGTP